MAIAPTPTPVQIRYVIVNENTTTVVGVGTTTNPNALTDSGVNERYLLESQWAVTDPAQNPAVGDLWDGSIPATFTTPVIDDDLANLTDGELRAELSKRIADVAEVVAVLDTNAVRPG